MIDKREIIDVAAALGLNPHVVEKDYVLGWLLWGIYSHEAVGESWLFKGGTCLKKCFFETYQFSEDLDFTITDPSHIDEGFLKTVFAEIGERIYEQTGIELPPDFQQFDIYKNPRGRESCSGRIGYQGPVSPRGQNMPRLKLDLTADEHVVLPPVQLQVFHPYSDAPDDGIVIQSYAYEEAFGEKVRALADRARPRDLYDVINLFRNAEARPTAAVLLDVLRQKCEFKGIEFLSAHTVDFAFVCIDQLTDGDSPRQDVVYAALSEAEVPFIDSGVSITLDDGSVRGAVTTSFYAAGCEAWKEAIPNARVQGNVPGYRNVQLPEVNALAASLAVMEWRRRTEQYVSESASFLHRFRLETPRIKRPD